MKKRIFPALLSFVILWVEYIQLQLSLSGKLTILSQQAPIHIAANLSILLCFQLFCWLFLPRWSDALGAGSLLLTLWATANVYVIQFHGSPLFPSTLASAGTALEVASSYSLTMNDTVSTILWLLLLSEALALLCRFLLEHEPLTLPRYWKRVKAFGLCCLALYLALFCNHFIKPRTVVDWSWAYSGETYGFPLCAVDNAAHMMNPYTVPDGYDANDLTVHPAEPKEPEQYPDILFILNETFCDLNLVADLRPDQDYLSDFYNIPDAFYGTAVISLVGGGTNNSEFEFLTSNSMYPLNAAAPFNFADLSHCGIVHYLKQLGYSATAMHCRSGTNYSRNTAYPQLGFDKVIMGQENFRYFSTNGKRQVLDTDNYQDMLEQYDAAGEGPRFLYLLTFQNHGGYEQNPDELDTVHTLNDFGDLTDDVNEYLSSLALSAAAFRELTEYLSASDRPVLMVMMGDHAPSFIGKLPHRDFPSKESLDITRKSVPFVIWSNFGAVPSSFTDFASAVDVAPMALEAAGLPLSDFYQTLLALHEETPIRSGTVTVDRQRKLGHYEPDDPSCELQRAYYCLEYHSLTAGSAFRSEFFQPRVK